MNAQNRVRIAQDLARRARILRRPRRYKMRFKTQLPRPLSPPIDPPRTTRPSAAHDRISDKVQRRASRNPLYIRGLDFVDRDINREATRNAPWSFELLRRDITHRFHSMMYANFFDSKSGRNRLWKILTRCRIWKKFHSYILNFSRKSF